MPALVSCEMRMTPTTNDGSSVVLEHRSTADVTVRDLKSRHNAPMARGLASASHLQ